jgi:RNA polymerase sigma-70 factor (ECF subfamily)
MTFPPASSPPSLIAAAYRTHGHHVLRRALRLLGNEADAGDVMHEVFLSLLDDPTQFEGRSSLTTWLYAATTNRCLNRLRDGRLRLRIVSERGETMPVASSIHHIEDAVQLRQLLTQLPADLATVAVYYFGEQMSHDEIASVLKCSRRHVGNLVERLGTAIRALEASSPSEGEGSS